MCRYCLLEVSTETSFLLSLVFSPFILKLDLLRSVLSSTVLSMLDRSLSSRKCFLAICYILTVTLALPGQSGSHCFVSQVEYLGQVVGVLVLGQGGVSLVFHLFVSFCALPHFVQFAFEVVFYFESVEKLVFDLGFEVTIVYMG